jgi:hypothetical protein
MEKISFLGLQPDIFFAQPWFEDFVEAYADVLNELIRDPMDQLENIRNVTSETDPWVAQQALKQIGFDLPADFIANNMNNLRSALQQLVHYAERSGTNFYPRQMEFIYGRSVDVVELYTNDYKAFYDRPYGPLLIDGGDWYKTTHVDLGMQLLPTDMNLIVPRNTELKDRFLDAFYELAPWNVVVERFHYNVEIDMTVYLSGVVFKHPKRYIDIGLDSYTIFDFVLDGPDTVSELSSATFVLTGTKEHVGEDGSKFITNIELDAEFSSSRPGLLTWTNNIASVGGVSDDIDVIVYANYKDHTVSKTIRVLNDLGNIESIYITGETNVRSTESHTYQVIARTRSGEEALTTPVVSVSPDVILVNNIADFSRVTFSKNVYLSASIRIGDVELTAVLPIFVYYVTDEVHVVGLNLTLPSSAFERSMVSINAQATYSDGHTRNVLAEYTTSSDAVRALPFGDVYVYDVESDINVDITGTYQDNGLTVTDTKSLLVRARQNDIISVDIIGPHTVMANTRVRYAVEATFADGSKGFVEATWTSTMYTIDEDGILNVGAVSTRTSSLILRARVDNKMVLKNVNLRTEPVVLNSIHIRGPDSLYEGSSAKFTAYSQYSNAMEFAIEPTWSVVNSPSWATINTQGILSFASPVEGIVEVRAEYIHNGRRFVQTRPIVLIPKTKTISGMIISGPNEVEDGQRIVLTATAIYSDNTTEIVDPLWTVFPEDPMNDKEVMADIVSPGVLQGRYVETPTKVVAVARYFKEVAEFTITVLPYVMKSPDIPVESRIIGPSTFTADKRASYAHMIRFENCDEIAVSSTWEIDVPGDVARIDGNGILWSENGRDAVITITSTYECGDQTVIDSIVVHAITNNEPTLQALKIYGPTTLNDKVPKSYGAELYYVDQEIREGIGNRVTPLWSIVGGENRVAVNSAGILHVVDNETSFSFFLRARYSENFETVEDTLEIFVNAQSIIHPSFGVGPIGVRTDAQVVQYLTDEVPDLDTGFVFSLTSMLGEYMYFCHPVSFGIARFFDLDSGFEGGWDGASWPDDGDIGTVYGPIVIQREDEQGNVSDWYLYRSDFDGLGELNFRIEF